MPKDESVKCLFGKRGFTLTELLAVIFIISILAVLLFAGIKSGVAAAKQSRCINNMHSLLHALIRFRADSDGYLYRTQSSGGGGAHISALIDKYLDEPFYAPGNCYSHAWSCPANPATPLSGPPWDAVGSSYVFNRNLIDDSHPELPYYITFKISSIKYPGRLLLMLERDPSKQPGAGFSIAHYAPDPYGDGGFYGHRAGNTLGFVDGHVESWQRTHPGFNTRGPWQQYWDPTYSEN